MRIPNIAQYLREPLWAFRSARPLAALTLCAQTARHHVANWTSRPRDDSSAFDISLDLGGSKPSRVSLRAVGGDLSILYEIFAERAYEISEASLAGDSVMTIIDCGAHVGLSALYLVNRYPKATVVAVEPNPDNFKLLLKNTKDEPRIKPVNGCISDKTGTAFISVSDYGSLQSIGTDGVEVPAFTLSNICDLFGIKVIDLLKMDIEGTEKLVFATGVKNVRAIAIELHGDYTADQFAADVAPLRVIARGATFPVFAI